MALPQRAEHRSLEDTPRSIWQEPLADLPVAKDIFRLAARIEVETITHQQHVEFVGPFLFRFRTPHEPSEEPVHEDSPHSPKLFFRNNPNWLEKLKAMGYGEHNLFHLVRGSKIIKDVTGFAESTGKVDPEILAEEKAELVLQVKKMEERKAHIKQLQEIRRIICDVARGIETSEKFAQISQTLDALVEAGDLGDGEMVMAKLFDDLGGDACATLRVFKAIHQNIIFPAVIELKEKLGHLVLTRDVRSRDGWLVFIKILDEVVIVTHQRREQSLATVPLNEQWWFEWQLHITFNKAMTELYSVMLRVTHLHFCDDFPPKKKEEIKRALCAGFLIL